MPWGSPQRRGCDLTRPWKRRALRCLGFADRWSFPATPGPSDTVTGHLGLAGCRGAEPWAKPTRPPGPGWEDLGGQDPGHGGVASCRKASWLGLLREVVATLPL